MKSTVWFKKVNESKSAEAKKLEAELSKIHHNVTKMKANKPASPSAKKEHNDAIKRYEERKREIRTKLAKLKPIKENEGFASELGEQDVQKQKAALNVTTNPVAEGGIRIFTFEQFLNEAEDFQSQYMPQYNPESGSEEDDDSDLGVPSAEETTDADNEDSPETEDDWNVPETGTENDEDDWDTEYNEVGPKDDISTTKNQVSALTDQITDILNQYKSGSLTIAQYKEKASPLLAQRKELQAKLDQAFNMSISGEAEDDEEM